MAIEVSQDEETLGRRKNEWVKEVGSAIRRSRGNRGSTDVNKRER